uniref:Uncharacterized protein n=1 Tax=Panagrellus redivivus TaxID=6233 RepID=A0A7E4WBA8_PANRE
MKTSMQRVTTASGSAQIYNRHRQMTKNVRIAFQNMPMLYSRIPDLLIRQIISITDKFRQSRALSFEASHCQRSPCGPPGWHTTPSYAGQIVSKCFARALLCSVSSPASIVVIRPVITFSSPRFLSISAFRSVNPWPITGHPF